MEGFLGEDIVRSVLIIQEAPRNEGHVLPQVDLRAGRHEVPVRNVTSENELLILDMRGVDCYLGMGHLLSRQASQFSLE